MKICKISLEAFRGFDAPFELNLGTGKNLLLHGENGSGKSSIYLALKRFFQEHGDDITSHRNQFSPAARHSKVTLTVSGKDSAGAVFDRDVAWTSQNIHPLAIPNSPAVAAVTEHQRATLVDAAHRSGFLDYRAMLRTHLTSAPLSRASNDAAAHAGIYGASQAGLERQLFDVVTRVILAGTSITMPGGTTARIGELISNVWKNPPATWHRRNLEIANNYANTFNIGFNSMLLELQSRLTEFLGYFDNHALGITFPSVSLAWDKVTRTLTGAELHPEVTFRGLQISEHHQILNEARLSALAICLFLAGVSLADNDFNNAEHPRFLLLDDTLIGLELQNRLPVLKLLTSDHFRHYQIFFLTHDRVWYDLARAHLPTDAGWLHMELRADEGTGQLIPIVKPTSGDIATARRHLHNNDLRAAAVYARAAFETRLQKVCEKQGIEISYRRDPKEVALDKLWQGIVERQKKREAKQAEQRTNGQPESPDFIPQSLIAAVNVIRSNVLNALSHTNPPPLVRVEVEYAILIVQQIQQHAFPDP